MVSCKLKQELSLVNFDLALVSPWGLNLQAMSKPGTRMLRGPLLCSAESGEAEQGHQQRGGNQAQDCELLVPVTHQTDGGQDEPKGCGDKNSQPAKG
jgi:hypothetical protein